MIMKIYHQAIKILELRAIILGIGQRPKILLEIFIAY